MKMRRQWRSLFLAGLGLALASSTGCQTQIAGMTLPTGYYLQHRPQYFPDDPDFPLQRELATMQAQTAAVATPVAPGAGNAQLPPPFGAPAPGATPPAAPQAPNAPR